MYRSGKYPKTLSKYIDTLGQKIKAEVVLNTIRYVDAETRESRQLVTSLEASGVAEVENTSTITYLLDRFSKNDPYDEKILEGGVLINQMILDQYNPDKPVLKLGFIVDYNKLTEWSILSFQEGPRY